MKENKESGPIKYNNLMRTSVIVETDDEYQERIKELNLDLLLNTFFQSFINSITKIKGGATNEEVFSIKRDDGSSVFFSFHVIKNSGIRNSRNRKRMQIYKNYYGQLDAGYIRNPSDSYFFIGLYPSGEKDNPICVILENDGITFNPKDSYSSNWIDFESLMDAYINGISYGCNPRTENKYICFTKKNFSLVMKSIMVNDYSEIIQNTKKNK